MGPTHDCAHAGDSRRPRLLHWIRNRNSAVLRHPHRRRKLSLRHAGSPVGHDTRRGRHPNGSKGRRLVPGLGLVVHRQTHRSGGSPVPGTAYQTSPRGGAIGPGLGAVPPAGRLRPWNRRRRPSSPCSGGPTCPWPRRCKPSPGWLSSRYRSRCGLPSFST